MENSEDKKIVDGLNEELKELGLDPIASESKGQDEIDLPGIDTGANDGEEEDESEEDEDSDESEEEEESDDEEDDEDSDDEEEDDESDESEDDEDEDEESDEDDESDKDSKNKKPRKFIPIKQHKDEKKKHREKVSGLETIIQDLTKKLEGKETSAEEQDEIKALATELGIEDPENFSKVLAFIEKSVSKKVQIDPAILASVEKMKIADENRKDREFFSSKWNEILPTVQADFKNATKENIAEARALMDKLWHSKEWHKFDADYVYFKNKAAFSKIISPRNKGLETGSSRHSQHDKGKKNNLLLPDNPSEDDLRKADDAIANLMADSNSLRPVNTKSI